MLRAEGREEQIGYFARHMSVDQAIVEFVQSASCGAPCLIATATSRISTWNDSGAFGKSHACHLTGL
jgi:hypothetical protein